VNIDQGAVSVGDVALAYRSVGEGRHLVIVHGGPGLGHTYMRPLDRWAAEFLLIYYDQRGSGHSPVGDSTKLGLTSAIQDLEQLRKGLGIDRANLVGHSFGALLALMYAVRHPDGVGALVLLNPAPPFVPELAEQLGSNMAARRTKDIDDEREAIASSDAFREGDPKAVERFILNVYQPFFKDPRTAEILNLGFTDISAKTVLELEERWFEELFSLDPVSVLAHIRCPTLVVYGQLDPTPSEFARLLVERVPSAELVVLPEVGHFAHVEDPEPLAEAVLPFLRVRAL